MVLAAWWCTAVFCSRSAFESSDSLPQLAAALKPALRTYALEAVMVQLSVEGVVSKATRLLVCLCANALQQRAWAGVENHEDPKARVCVSRNIIAAQVGGVQLSWGARGAAAHRCWPFQ